MPRPLVFSPVLSRPCPPCPLVTVLPLLHYSYFEVPPFDPLLYLSGTLWTPSKVVGPVPTPQGLRVFLFPFHPDR